MQEGVVEKRGAGEKEIGQDTGTQKPYAEVFHEAENRELRARLEARPARDILDDVDYYQSLPKKRAGAGMVLLNKHGELLLVKPSYKDHWAVPGGVVEEDESPRAACIRETQEEIGLVIADPKFICVDYIADDGIKGENYQFLFFGGILADADVARIKLQKGELSEFRFVPLKTAPEFASKKFSKRTVSCLKSALKGGQPVYLENGEIPRERRDV